MASTSTSALPAAVMAAAAASLATRATAPWLALASDSVQQVHASN